MSKCENCIHYDVCCEMVTKHNKQFFVCGDKGNEGQHFKDKSLFVELPVKVGQTVRYIKGGYYNSPHKKPCAIEVTEINQKWHGKILDWGFIANGTRYRFSSIGKTVFLTKEEAEAKLKEIEGK